jgi:hypothetical protein
MNASLNLGEHVELRNLKKLVDRQIVPYRVHADGVTVEVWDGLTDEWQLAEKHASKAACERWEKLPETRETYLDFDNLSKFAGKPFLGRVVRIGRPVGGKCFLVRVAPGWTHELTIDPAEFVQAVRRIADDESTVIDADRGQIADLEAQSYEMTGKAAPAEKFATEGTEATEVEDAELVAPEASGAVTIAPQEVSAQYRRAVNGVLEMVRFGAMLMEVEVSSSRVITRDNTGKIDGREDGLRGWLASNCPEVNYQTAMRFKHLAEGVHARCKVPAATPLRLCLPGPGGDMDATPADVAAWTGPGRRVSDDKLRQLRQEVWQLIDGKSARQLQFAFVSEAGPKGGALHVGELTEEQKYARRRADAHKLWTEGVDRLSECVKTYKNHLLLDADVARMLVVRVEFLRDALKAAAGE